MEHAKLGAYISDVNYEMWVKSGGKTVYTEDEHTKKKKENEKEEKKRREDRDTRRDSRKRKSYNKR